jgi:hypothetical protein
VGTVQELEETLRGLACLLSEPEDRRWRKRVQKYAEQIASGNLSGTSDFLAMYQGSMGSFLDVQGRTSGHAHQELTSLRDRAYRLARDIL